MIERKPTIIKVVQQALEERAPPQPDDYEFIETWPANDKTEQPPAATQ